MEQYRTHRTDIGRNLFLASMKEQNTVLYYRLLQDHLKEMFSIIYTPTEGEATANYSRIFRRSQGCFLDIVNMDDIELSVSRWEPDDIDIIVCSDGEQILGIHVHARKLYTPKLTSPVLQALAIKESARCLLALLSWYCIPCVQA